MSGRLAVATLDAEARWARERYGSGAPAPPERVMRGLASVGTLMRAFCDEGDRVWLVRPVDSERVVDVPGLCRPALVHGEVDWGASAACLPWAEVLGVARRPAGPAGELWSAPSIGTLQREVNHRRVGFEIARDLGLALDGAAWVDEPGELERALAALVARRGALAPWVLKPAYSAAGRDRVRGRGVALAQIEREAVARVCATGGGVVEPWLTRVSDYGWRGWAGASDVESRGGHELLVDGEGRFKGIAVGGVVPGEVEPTALAIGRALVARGYRGPYTVDAFTYDDGVGVRVHPCCEVNARLSFGWVAAALRARVATSLAIPAEAVVRLEIGRDADASREGASHRVALLRPGRSDPWGAWLAW